MLVWRMRDAEQAKELSGALAKALAKSAGAKEQDGVLAFDGGAGAQLTKGRVAVLAFAPTGAEAKKLAAAAPR